MKKAFEFFLMLIIFYGVYSAFNAIFPMLAPEVQNFWVIIIALLVAAGLLLLYSRVITSEAQRKMQAKITNTIKDLETKVNEKVHEIEQKDVELNNAFKIKKAVEVEAENTIQD